MISNAGPLIGLAIGGKQGIAGQYSSFWAAPTAPAFQAARPHMALNQHEFVQGMGQGYGAWSTELIEGEGRFKRPLLGFACCR